MTPDSQRSNPFGDADDDDLDVSAFTVQRTQTSKPVDPGTLDAVAQASGFNRRVGPAAVAPTMTGQGARSAASQQRRYRTGRNLQLGLKCRAETRDRFFEMADRLAITQAELFERMVALYETQLTAKSR